MKSTLASNKEFGFIGNKKMKQLNSLLNMLTLLILFMFSSAAWATCQYLSGYNETTGLRNYTLPVATYSVPRNTVANVAIGPVISGPNTASTRIDCDGTKAYTMLKYAASLDGSSAPHIAKTNIKGIGVKAWSEWSVHPTQIINNPTPWVSWYMENGPWKASVSPGSFDAYLIAIKLQLYTTGEAVVPGKVVFSTPIVEAWLNSFQTFNGAVTYGMIGLTGEATINVAACETPDVKVMLGKHYASDFSGLNSKTSSTPFNFSINNCNPGLNSVKYKFSPISGMDLVGTGQNQYIKLSNGSSATGVGIQVLDEDSNPISFNSNITFSDYSGAGSYSIPMKARYIQTASTITGGTANSAIEFTMTYE